MPQPTYRFDSFSLREMTLCGVALRKIGVGATCMEEVATRLVNYFRDSFRDPETGESAIVLSRCFTTLRYGRLEESNLREVAQAASGSPDLSDDVRCLTLLATAGENSAWNDRHQSSGHQVIPLQSKQFVLGSPMIAQLIQQLGLEIESVLAPDPALLVDLEQQTFNIFHVEQALASPYVPAQEEFVIPYGVESVLGFGGLMPSGNLFSVVLFSKTAIKNTIATRFKSLALNAKFALVPFDGGQMFRSR